MSDSSQKKMSFTRNKTGDTLFDSILDNPSYGEKAKGLHHKIVDLTPDEYIKYAAHTFDVENPESIINDLVNDRLKNVEKLNKLKEIENLHMPVLSYGNKSGAIQPYQEGLHRALAAKQQGIQKIPTMVLGSENYENVPKGLKQLMTEIFDDTKKVGEVMSDYGDNEAKRRYEILEKKRIDRIAKNILENRTGFVKGTPVFENKKRAVDPYHALETLRNEGKVTNVENTFKQTPNDTIGIDAKVRNKSKFLNLDKKIGQDIAEGVEDAAEVAKKEAPLLKNSKGFAKLLPMLGLGAAGLGALSIANKVHAGELEDAGLEATDLATDYVPGVGQIKMALRPTETGDSELPEEEMQARQKFNEAMKKRMNERLK